MSKISGDEYESVSAKNVNNVNKNANLYIILQEDDVVEVITTHDYVSDARRMIYDHDDITIENALYLNKQMQTHLSELRTRLEQMLLACQNKYKRNEAILANMTKINNELAKARRTYFYCGYPYFKNRQAFGAPPPAEFDTRFRRQREFFPSQLAERRLWTPAAKVHLIQAVKKQVITFLQTKNKDQIRMINAGKADDAPSKVNALVEGE